MTTRTNLAVRPSLKNSATNWFGPSGWARITNANPALPRQTALAGSTPGNIATEKVPVTPGLPYVASVSIYFVAASIGKMNIDWYASGATYLSTTSGPTFNNSAGTINRPGTGVVIAPAGAVEGLVTIDSLDGAAQVTALLWEQTSVDGGTYFDGDTPGAVWLGTNGSSMSRIDLSGQGALTGTLPAPVGVAVGLAHYYGSLTGNLPGLAGAIGLTASVTYDEALGRIRITAAGFSPDVHRVVVSRRRAGTSAWTEVRGGRVPVQSGQLLRTVDDYEFPAGTTVQYRIVGYASAEEAVSVVGQTAILDVANTMSQGWLKFISAPYLNRPITLRGWDEVTRPARAAVYPVAGRRDPVVVTDVHGARQVTVRLRTATQADGDALDEALARGHAIFLHLPIATALPSLYAVAGDYTWRQAATRGYAREWEIPLTEVATPPPSVVGAGVTWQVLDDRHVTWQEVIDTYPTWSAVIG